MKAEGEESKAEGEEPKEAVAEEAIPKAEVK